MKCDIKSVVKSIVKETNRLNIKNSVIMEQSECALENPDYIDSKEAMETMGDAFRINGALSAYEHVMKLILANIEE